MDQPGVKIKNISPDTGKRMVAGLKALMTGKVGREDQRATQQTMRSTPLVSPDPHTGPLNGFSTTVQHGLSDSPAVRQGVENAIAAYQGKP